MVLSNQTLYEDREMRKGVIGCHIAQLIAITEFQEKVKQVRAETQALPPSITVTINQERLPMEPIQPFAGFRDVGFKAEVAHGFLDPERRLSRRSGGDAQRHYTGSV